MKKYKNTIIDLSFMLSIVISNIFYVILNTSSRGAHTLITDLDKVIPFIKYFIIPYIAWYPFIALGLIIIYFNNRKTYFKSIITLNISLIICYIIFYFFQTTVPRPTLVGNDIFIKLVKIIYGHDNPYNCFPSVHVITTYVIMRGLNISLKNKLLNYSLQIVGLSIILSTVFVKQHVVLDIFSAILINEVIISILNFVKLEDLFKSKVTSIKTSD